MFWASLLAGCPRHATREPDVLAHVKLFLPTPTACWNCGSEHAWGRIPGVQVHSPCAYCGVFRQRSRDGGGGVLTASGRSAEVLRSRAAQDSYLPTRRMRNNELGRHILARRSFLVISSLRGHKQCLQTWLFIMALPSLVPVESGTHCRTAPIYTSLGSGCQSRLRTVFVPSKGLSQLSLSKWFARHSLLEDASILGAL